MPSPEEIAAEKERLYESSSLRDDLNDAEATILLEWGQSQIDRLATEFPEEFEQKARFMRQLLKGINRFVGQREFNEMEGQMKYMKKVIMYLEPLGWEGPGADELFAALPDDKANMTGNLLALLQVLSPASDDNPEDEPAGDPDNITENDDQELENPNPHSINLAENNPILGDELDYGEE